MSFTYSPLFSDLDRVRFHVGDTDAAAPKFSDEEINAVLAEYEGSYKAATLACIRNLIARLSNPNFKSDWLQVDHDAAVASLRRLYAEKSAEFGLTAGRSFTSGVTHTRRSDAERTD